MNAADIARSLLRRAAPRLGCVVVPRKPGFHLVPDIYGRSSQKMRDVRADPEFFEVAREAVEGDRSLLYYDRLAVLYQALKSAARCTRASLPIRVLEVGVYRGGTSRFLAQVASRRWPDRAEQWCVDTFEGHSEKDVPQGREGAQQPGQFGATSHDDVVGLLAPFPFVRVLRGRIQDRAGELDGASLSFIHLDVDLYEPTRFVLETLGPRLGPGGVVVVDDYGFLSCPGVKAAVDEFVDARGSGMFMLPCDTGQCVLVRCGE